VIVVVSSCSGRTSPRRCHAKQKATWRAMNPQQRFDAVAKYKNVAACSAICLVIFVLVAHSTIKHWPSIPVHHLP
jgi:hypothetical protein